MTEGKTTKTEEGVREVEEAALYEAALRYLARYSASREQVRRVLLRRLKRRGGEAAGGMAIEAVLERLGKSGALDDARFAAARARSLRERGLSRRAIEAHLLAKGVGGATLREALAAVTDDGAELIAAARLVRRKRLGCYRSPAERETRYAKDLAALSRAGFPLDLARRLLATDTPDEIEALIAGQ
jgi:regulatory protein